jgi:2-dehydropantoate 2-reductase
MTPRKIGIIGAGNVGKILAAHLSKAGHEVYAVEVRKDVIDAIEKLGVKVSGVMDLSARVTKMVPAIGQLAEYDVSHVFISTKVYVMPGIVNELRSLDDHKTCFISFQNGLGLQDILTPHIDNAYLFRAIVNYAGKPVVPGHVEATFFHKPNFIGCLPDAGPETVERAEDIATFLTEAELDTEYTPEINKRAWQKTILNSCLMPTSVLTRLTMGRIMQIAETRDVVEKHMMECLAVAKAEGYVFGDDFKDKAMKYLSGAGEHKTSMLVDFENGNPLEIDYLNGKIQECADKHGIPCKYNMLMLSLVKGLVEYRNKSKNAEVKRAA